MNQQERDVITGIFDRLKQVENQPRDPEAERYIAERVARQPYAPYAMAQAIYVQEQALTNLHQRAQELEAEVERLRVGQGSGGFLSGLFGAGRQVEAARPVTPQAVPPPAASPVPQAQPVGPWAQAAAGRGGFLATALSTAAGVAGGMLLGNAIASAFGRGGQAEAAAKEAPGGAAESAPAVQDASYDEADYEDDGDVGDLGEGDDWA
ncbi:DUF2076 domain-containing protein [Chelatococcus sp. SYSU_G07232]|uniref:DUF2076 domain-containing protein n=1 Tax=Chelatococcus albus TaxID=3047466 RepID=A0ABT7AEX0_9HYPH|nr:DUF2076 domain-containing protein [Chelatococcus sp. SYSU_G07232]MDJ1157910.1 DUF2076 domain-containing protein [Chelatococcus sp. SYSU_G07232]